MLLMMAGCGSLLLLLLMVLVVVLRAVAAAAWRMRQMLEGQLLLLVLWLRMMVWRQMLLSGLPSAVRLAEHGQFVRPRIPAFAARQRSGGGTMVVRRQVVLVQMVRQHVVVDEQIAADRHRIPVDAPNQSLDEAEQHHLLFVDVQRRRIAANAQLAERGAVRHRREHAEHVADRRSIAIWSRNQNKTKQKLVY